MMSKKTSRLEQAVEAGQNRDYQKAADILLGLITNGDAGNSPFLYLGRSYTPSAGMS